MALGDAFGLMDPLDEVNSLARQRAPDIAGPESPMDPLDALNRLYRKVTGLVEAIDSGKCERDEEEDIVNPWVRVKGWHRYDHGNLTEVLGPWPVPSIAHVPEDKLVYYAVRDADATLRVYRHMQHLKPWIFYS